jgi:hypothetical protein
MNRRIRKKRRDQVNRLLANGIRLYASRPAGADLEEISRAMLGLNIGLALWARHDFFERGPRRHWGILPPALPVISAPDDTTLVLKGPVEYRSPGGDRIIVVEQYHVHAKLIGKSWRVTLFTTTAEPAIPPA